MTSSSSQVYARIPELDGLRGLAILLVVFHHYAAFVATQSLAARIICTISPLSWTGVDLFFVLSGFLIGGILMDHRDSENYFRTFYLRRICRIFPLYFLWLGLFFILPWLLSNYRPQIWFGCLFVQDYSRVPRWSFAAFLQNIYFSKTYLAGAYWMLVTWSLAVEEQFYLLLPIVVWLVPVRKLPCVLIPLILFAPVFRLFLYLYHPEIDTLVLLPCRMDTLLIGVLCAYCIRCQGWRAWLDEKQGLLYLMLLALLAGAGYLTVHANSPNSFEMVFLGFTWMALFYACLLLIAVIAKKGTLGCFMRFRPLCNLGIISYGIYIMHLAVNIVMRVLILGRLTPITNLLDGTVALASFMTTLFLAALSWRFFEKPILNWGHSFLYVDKNIFPKK